MQSEHFVRLFYQDSQKAVKFSEKLSEQEQFISDSFDAWHQQISRRAAVPGLYRCGSSTPSVDSALLRAALGVNCFLGASPSVDLLGEYADHEIFLHTCANDPKFLYLCLFYSE